MRKIYSVKILSELVFILMFSVVGQASEDMWVLPTFDCSNFGQMSPLDEYMKAYPDYSIYCHVISIPGNNDCLAITAEYKGNEFFKTMVPYFPKANSKYLKSIGADISPSSVLFATKKNTNVPVLTIWTMSSRDCWDSKIMFVEKDAKNNLLNYAPIPSYLKSPLK